MVSLAAIALTAARRQRSTTDSFFMCDQLQDIAEEEQRTKEEEYEQERLIWRGEGPVTLRGFKGMFAHPLNGLKGIEASIFLSTHFREGSPREMDQFCPLTDCTSSNRCSMSTGTHGKIQLLK